MKLSSSKIYLDYLLERTKLLLTPLMAAGREPFPVPAHPEDIQLKERLYMEAYSDERQRMMVLSSLRIHMWFISYSLYV